MNSSAVANRPADRRAIRSTRRAAQGTATQKAMPTGGLDGRSRPADVGCAPRFTRPAPKTAPEAGWRVPPDRCDSVARVGRRRPHPRRLVTDPHEHPDEQEAGVQRPVGLGQRADRQVILVGSGVDAEHVPGQRHREEHQPGSDTPQGPPAAAAARTRPRLGDGFETPAEAAPFRPCRSATSAATTAPSETTQVTSAGVVLRW